MKFFFISIVFLLITSICFSQDNKPFIEDSKKSNGFFLSLLPGVSNLSNYSKMYTWPNVSYKKNTDLNVLSLGIEVGYKYIFNSSAKIYSPGVLVKLQPSIYNASTFTVTLSPMLGYINLFDLKNNKALEVGLNAGFSFIFIQGESNFVVPGNKYTREQGIVLNPEVKMHFNHFNIGPGFSIVNSIISKTQNPDFKNIQFQSFYLSISYTF